MGKYIHYFETETEFNEERTNNYSEPWVSYTEGVDMVNYDKTEDEKRLGTPFTIEALGSGNITWKLDTKTVQYSKNGGSWETRNSATTISVVRGDEVRFKGTNQDYYGNSISSTAQFNVKGNIMSLTNGDEFVIADTVNAYGFYSLFSGCTYLVSASDLILPATTLANSCYYYMFSGCTSLTTAPELPATSLTSSCYLRMFSNCTGLTTAPELPATTLGRNCYNGMFTNCKSLTTAPELPATTLAPYCYDFMFLYCTNLTTAPELPATTLAEFCYQSMFNGCTSLTTAPELPATTLVDSCYYGMFQGCTSLTTAPELTATTLATYCYGNMFSGCTNLTTAPELPATTLASACYNSMFKGCTKLNYVKAMFIELTATNATTNWLSGVSSTGTFVKNASATWTTTGVNGVPTGWTVETASS